LLDFLKDLARYEAPASPEQLAQNYTRFMDWDMSRSMNASLPTTNINGPPGSSSEDSSETSHNSIIDL
jgi:hypothetical protein